MNILLDYDKTELYQMLESFGEPKYRIDQLINAIYSGKNYEDKVNLPASFIQKLKDYNYVLQPITIRKAMSFVLPYFSIIVLAWIVIVLGWYLIGIPLGPSAMPTL